MKGNETPDVPAPETKPTVKVTESATLFNAKGKR
jgi:hypothetical protein